MPYQLVVIKGRSVNQVLKLPSDGVTTVGRQQGCQIRIGSSQVSRKHCEFFEKHGHLLVKDLNSSNGTIVNGQKVEGQQVLEPGNVLLIGSVAFRVEQAGAPVAGPTAAPGGPGDTAVTQPAAVGGDAVGGDADIDLDFEQVDEELAGESSEEPGTEAPAAEATGSRPEEEAAPLTNESAQEIGEDAVAEYLLNIELDDEDKL